MNLAEWPRELAYVVIFIAAAVEGEVVFVSASILASLGRLDPSYVLIAGALGASAGDQFFFYALRGRLRCWLSRFPRLAERREEVVARIHRHSAGIILACRFLPGLRIAIPAACAYAGVPAVRFTTLSLIGSLAWSGTILFLIAHAGPVTFAQMGLEAWWTPIVPAILILCFFYCLGRRSRTFLQAPARTDGGMG